LLDENIETLPDITLPSVFGLHSNAEITYFQLFADTIWKDLLKMQSTGGSGGGDGNKDAHIVSVA